MNRNTITALWRIAERSMTPDQWRAFDLHYREGISQSEIAALLGISREAANQRIHRGLANFARAIALLATVLDPEEPV